MVSHPPPKKWLALTFKINFVAYQVDDFAGMKKVYLTQKLGYGIFGGQNPMVGMVLIIQGLNFIGIAIGLTCYFIKTENM